MMVEVDFIDGSFLAGGPGGNVNLITYEGELEQIELPSNLTPIRERVSFASMRKGDISRLFTAGGLTGNGMFTEQRFFLRQFIQNPTQEVIESTTPSEEQIGLEQVAGSTGPTGLCVFYFRFRDSLHGRRSPFSMGSPTLNLDGTEAVRVRNFPLGPEPADICVDQIEVWVSRNGAAKRRLATRDIGTTDFTITETIEYEAETQVGLQKVPRCKYNAVWHDRLWQAGGVGTVAALLLLPVTAALRLASRAPDDQILLSAPPAGGLHERYEGESLALPTPLWPGPERTLTALVAT